MDFAPGQAGEGRGIRAGDEHLAADPLQGVEQCGAAARIEMRGDLVEQRERRDARHVGDEPRMRENEPDQQRLLFARRGAAPPARPSARAKRSRSPRCGPISVRPAAASRPRLSRSHRAIAVLGLERGMLAASASTSPLKRTSAQGNGEASSRPAAISAASRLTHSSRAAATATPSSAASRSTASSQRAVARALFEQAVAPAQRALELADPRAVGGIDRQHEPVEKPPPLARRPGEQPSIAGVSQTRRR